MILQVIINKTNSEATTVELFTDLRAMTDRFKVLQEEGQIIEITSAEL